MTFLQNEAKRVHSKRDTQIYSVAKAPIWALVKEEARLVAMSQLGLSKRFLSYLLIGGEGSGVGLNKPLDEDTAETTLLLNQSEPY